MSKLHAIAPLSAAERDLLKKVVIEGPGAFVEAGFNDEQVQAFINKPSVVREMEILEAEYRNRDTIFGLSKFVTRKNLLKLADASTAILANALMGPEYVRDDNGNIRTDERGNPLIAEAGPSPLQVAAAKEILDRIGVHSREEKAENKGPTEANVRAMLKKAEEVDLELEYEVGLDTDEQKALSRERVRNFMDVLASKLPEAKKRAERELNPQAKPKAKPKAKKKVKT